jgi:hypothetical protein
VVGRVGRPIASSIPSSNSLNPPEVIFLINQSSSVTKEDKIDFGISQGLIRREKQYRVASPFLQFLNQLKIEWKLNMGQSPAELVQNLAERTDLDWITNSQTKKDLSTLLRLLDEHITALIEELDPNEKADDWLQARSAEIIDLLVGVTTIQPADLKFIKEAIQARAIFIAKHRSEQLRHQDYLLGLPLEDCEAIRANKNRLLVWYKGCTDIFARKWDSGIDMLVELLNFVSSLSVCKKWRSDQIKPLPMFDLPDKYTIARRDFFKSWILGEDTEILTQKLRQLHPDADFDEYREEMFEGGLTRGLSAVCRLLDNLAREDWFFFKDLEYLPSLVKYGVSGKLACSLVRRKIPREAAVQIADLYIKKMKPDYTPEEDFAQSIFASGEKVISSLTEDEIASLQLGEAVIERIKEIKRWNLKS